MQVHGIREDHRSDTIGREGEVTMDLTAIGKRVSKKDAPSKVTGSAAYIQDVKIPGMLYGKILYSRYPHARIRSLDTTKASRLPGVKAVLTGAAVLSFCGLGAAGRAGATLGGDVPSVLANQAHLGAARQVQKVAGGERHELTLPSGIVVHQYVSARGAVYAITWKGPRLPDLRELLGPYFAQLERRDAYAPLGHHRLSLDGTDFSIRSAGHRGSFSGRAWVPSLVPAGVTIDNSLD